MRKTMLAVDDDLAVVVQFLRFDRSDPADPRQQWRVTVTAGKAPDQRILFQDETLSLPARTPDATNRAMSDALRFLTSYATGDHDGPVLEELAPYADVLDAMEVAAR